MQRAVQIAEAALNKTLPLIKAGMTERELAGELSIQLLRAGSEPETPFSPIVASGPNAALPHAVPTDRQLSAGDTLILDWGAAHKGYKSDITRTFAIGELNEELMTVHAIVEQANASSRATVRPGATCGEIDRAAREAITAAGYGEYFIHRTGHGLGLEEHEPPNVRADEQTILEPGMAFTVEPGIYLPGQGGVRIEDDVVVTDEGGRSLTSLPRQLQILG
jgi:Xaa-Pro dipeptidase